MEFATLNLFSWLSNLNYGRNFCVLVSVAFFFETLRANPNLPDRIQHTGLWHWDFPDQSAIDPIDIHPKCKAVLEHEKKTAEFLLQSFRHDIRAILHSADKNRQQLEAFIDGKSISENTAILLRAVLQQDDRSEFMQKVEATIALYQGYLQGVESALKYLQEQMNFETQQTYDETLSGILRALYSSDHYAASIYRTFSSLSHNRYPIVEFKSVKLHKPNLSSLQRLEKLLPLNRIYNLYEAIQGFEEFQPILLKFRHKSAMQIADLIKSNEWVNSELDNEYRVLRASVGGQSGSLNLVDDIEFIDRLLSHRFLKRPLTFQFGKQLLQRFGYDEDHHTYRADVDIGQCSKDDLGFGWEGHPCIESSDFNPQSFLTIFENQSQF